MARRFHQTSGKLFSKVQVCWEKLDTAGTVYHLVIYMQSNKIHNVVLTSKFIQHLCYLDMFRTSPVHHQERFVQAVFADFGMWYYVVRSSSKGS